MKRKLSAARKRSDLITGFDYSAPLAAAATQTAALADAAPSPPAAAGGGSGYQPAPYEPDADETVTCPECSKQNSPDAKFCDQCGYQLEGADDVETADAAQGTEAAAVVTPPAAAPGAPPVANPVTGQGVDNGVVCTTPDCGHLAAAHVNTDAGDNMGACSTDGCDCMSMSVDAVPNPSADDTTEQDAAASEGFATPVPAGPVEEAVVEPSAALNAPPAIDGGDSMGPAFTIPVAIIEGQPTSDGRQIAVGALTWRVPPLPLMGLATETHDPEGFDQNDPAVICGRIDSFERVDGEGATAIILARGYYLPNDDGMYFAELNEAMGRMGVSADVAVQASEVTIGDIDADGWPIDMSEILTEGTIMGLTVCPYPAFEGAYVVLGDGTEPAEATAIPQTGDDLPVVPATPPAAVAAGGQLIHLLTYEECTPCDQGLEVIVAAGAGPTRPPKAWFSNPNFTQDDGRLVEILDRRGQRALGGKFACPITVEPSGRVYGHIAPWNICHTGAAGQCILAPHSAVDYAHFKRGQHVTTAEGDRIRVGVLTADTGHAPTSGISAAAAMAHYDNTALAAADVNIGEDDYGIWVAGAIRPEATDEQIRKLTASSISGDWRNMGGQLELVAALAVNQPGFPLAVVAGGHVDTLVAAGGNVMHRLKHPVDRPGHDQLFAALGPLAAKLARERIAAATS